MTSILRALTSTLGSRRGTGGDGQSAPRGEEARRTLALPRFLDVGKTLTLSHAEISALYCLVEDCFERRWTAPIPTTRSPRRAPSRAPVARSDPVLGRRRARGIYADLIELSMGDVIAPRSGGSDRPPSAGCR